MKERERKLLRFRICVRASECDSMYEKIATFSQSSVFAGSAGSFSFNLFNYVFVPSSTLIVKFKLHETSHFWKIRKNRTCCKT